MKIENINCVKRVNFKINFIIYIRFLDTILMIRCKKKKKENGKRKLHALFDTHK